MAFSKGAPAAAPRQAAPPVAPVPPAGAPGDFPVVKGIGVFLTGLFRVFRRFFLVFFVQAYCFTIFECIFQGLFRDFCRRCTSTTPLALTAAIFEHLW